jgi:hypothetical protein
MELKFARFVRIKIRKRKIVKKINKKSKYKAEFIVYQNTWSNQRAKRRKHIDNNTQTQIDKSQSIFKFYLKLISNK